MFFFEKRVLKVFLRALLKQRNSLKAREKQRISQQR
jgi:hypothetical protein